MSHAAPAKALDAMRSAFDDAAKRVPVVQMTFALAGRSVRLRIAGRELAVRTREPFAHLESEDTSLPELCADLWDSAETGVANPCPVEEADFDQTWRSPSAAFRWRADGRIIAHEKAGVATWLDRSAPYIVGCAANAGSLRLEDRGRPLRVALAIWHYDQGVFLVHAGMVADGDRGILLPGRGGSGKSTTALACASDGLAYLGDDNVSLEADGHGGFRGHSVYASAWLDPAHLKRFSRLSPRAVTSTADEDKSLLLLSRVSEIRLQQSARICALALPTIVNRPDSRLRPLSKLEALRALAPSTVLGMFPRPGPHVFERMGTLVEKVQCFRLEIGAELQQISRCVRELLQQVDP